MNEASDPLWKGNWITDLLDSFKNEQICELNLHNSAMNSSILSSE